MTDLPKTYWLAVKGHDSGNMIEIDGSVWRR